MKRTLAALVAVLFLIPLSAQAVVECPNPDRPIHYSPYCLTEAEWVELTAPRAKEIVPAASGEPLIDLVRVIAWYFWPDWAAERMVRIAKCESNYLPTAQHPGSKAAGLWQIMPFWQRSWPGDYFDPWTNGAVAYQIWLEADRWGDPFTPWVCKG